MFKKLLLALVAGSAVCCQNTPIKAVVATTPTTFCNPVDIEYRFMLTDAGIREAADPVVVIYKNDYYLFASKSSGYWHSTDMNDWQYVNIVDSVLPIEDYAPAVYVDNGYIYYIGSRRGNAPLYRSSDPKSGAWEYVTDIPSDWDPAFYAEGDSLYIYYGSSPTDPIRVVTLDRLSFKNTSKPKECLRSDTSRYGWERPGENNEAKRLPYIEGAWMTKHGDKYYLQYSAPGTETKTYADGVYVADSPTGPFEYAPYNPISYKMTGFACGAGHGCTYTDKMDNYWRAATVSISVQHWFERRLALFPAGFDKDGVMLTHTYMGDYPTYLPGADKKGRTDWMLLSYNKPVSVSSSIDSLPARLAADEEIRSYWAAQSADTTEYMTIDLQEPCSINAIQINFAEHGSKHRGRNTTSYQNYVLYASNDAETWHPILDKSQANEDRSHPYFEFAEPFKARYIKLRNAGLGCGTHFSVRDLRIFGTGNGSVPAAVDTFSAQRSSTDPCHATITWQPVADADGYMIRYGIAPDKLYNSFQIWGENSYTITGLSKGTNYHFTIDSYNENGITTTTHTQSM